MRPTKLVMQKLEAGLDQVQIRNSWRKNTVLRKKRQNLLMRLRAGKKSSFGKLNAGEGFSLYVGIPFCPSICSYCSFSSSPVGEWKDKIDAYLDALIKELKALGRMAGERKPDTVYVGGGTPTTLEAGQLDRLLGTIRNCFDLSELKEFTVEAGRPDSITERKAGSDPQISGDENLRQSTDDAAEDTGSGRKKAYRRRCRTHFSLARELGFR